MKRWLGTMAAMAVFTVASAAHAQADRTTRILVGFPPGGSVDLAARAIAERMSADLNRPVVVENRPGAGGRIAAEVLKTAAPDGATLMLSPITIPVIAPMVFSKLAYDPATDLAPVAHVANFRFALSVGAGHPAQSLGGLLDWYRANPAQANYGTPGAGGLPHFFGVGIGRTAGIDLVHVPYTGGAPLLTALVGGQVSAGIDTMTDHIELHRAGRTRILAVSGTQRSAQLPDVPTFGEAGLAGIESGGWFAMFAPGRTPAAVIDPINAAVVRALASPEVRERFTKSGLEPAGGTPADLAALIRRDGERWAPVVKASGFRGD